MNLLNRISITSEKRSGQPCIRDLRITVGDVLSYLASGMSVEEIINDFPSLTKEDILAALQYASLQINRTSKIQVA